MTALTESQKKFYEEALQQTKQEIQDLEGQIQEELAKVKEKIASLQVAQKAASGSACPTTSRATRPPADPGRQDCGAEIAG